jgi:protoporphyrinogen oxidase
MSSTRVVVLGGGIAGLTASRELQNAGVEVQLFESGSQVAGLASTHRDPDGFSFDLGAHFITNRLAAAVGISAECRVVRRYGEMVRLDGHFYGYPTGLLANPRLLMSAISSRVAGPHGDPDSAQEWFRQEYGRQLADRVALPLLEAWSGVDPRELSADVGEKIPGTIAHTLYLRAAAKVTRRAVAIGYCNTQPQSASVFHVYPRDGVSTVCEALARDLGDSVHLDSPVEAILADDQSVRAVRVGGTEVEADAVVSTAPINRLPSIVEGTDQLEPFAKLEFRPMILANLKLEGRGLLPDTVTWFPDERPFFRATEAPISMPWLAPAGKTTILCDIGAEVGDPLWTLDDEAIAGLCRRHLTDVVPDVEHRYIGCHVARTPIAYPVFRRSYDHVRRSLHERGTGISGLLSIGRNGGFRHDLMEDVYWRTIASVRQWLRASENGRATIQD